MEVAKKKKNISYHVLDPRILNIEILRRNTKEEFTNSLLNVKA